MKVLLLQDDFPPESKGGAGNVAGILTKALKKAGHDVQVIAATQTPERAGWSEWEGVPVYRIVSDYHERWRGYRSLYNPSTARALKRLMGEVHPDVVHAHNIHYHLGYWSLYLAKRTEAKVVLTAHDEMLFHYGKFYESTDKISRAVNWRQLATRFRFRWNPVRNIVIRWCVRGVTIAAVSHAIADALRDNRYRCTVVYNGIPLLPAADMTAFVEEFKLRGAKSILFAGRISRLKGSDAALMMFESVRAHIPEAQLIIAGAAGRDGNGVIYTGWLSPNRMREAFAAACVVVVPSIYLDPLPTVALEAMEAHRPVVATFFGGAKEMVVDECTGFIVDPRNINMFARRVAELLNDEEKAIRFGEAGYQRLQEEFTDDRMAREYIELYQS